MISSSSSAKESDDQVQRNTQEYAPATDHAKR
jgi:hypothetical protein